MSHEGKDGLILNDQSTDAEVEFGDSEKNNYCSSFFRPTPKKWIIGGGITAALGVGTGLSAFFLLSFPPTAFLGLSVFLLAIGIASVIYGIGQMTCGKEKSKETSTQLAHILH